MSYFEQAIEYPKNNINRINFLIDVMDKIFVDKQHISFEI